MVPVSLYDTLVASAADDGQIRVGCRWAVPPGASTASGTLPAEADNLVGIYAALSDTGKADVLRQFGGQGWGAFKPALADLAVAKLAPIAGEIRRMVADPAFIDAFMTDGADRASAIAEATMTEVRRIVGFVR